MRLIGAPRNADTPQRHCRQERGFSLVDFENGGALPGRSRWAGPTEGYRYWLAWLRYAYVLCPVRASRGTPMRVMANRKKEAAMNSIRPWRRSSNSSFGRHKGQRGVCNPCHLEALPAGSSEGQRKGHRADREGANEGHVKDVWRDDQRRKSQQTLRHERGDSTGRQQSWNEVKGLLSANLLPGARCRQRRRTWRTQKRARRSMRVWRLVGRPARETRTPEDRTQWQRLDRIDHAVEVERPAFVACSQERPRSTPRVPGTPRPRQAADSTERPPERALRSRWQTR